MPNFSDAPLAPSTLEALEGSNQQALKILGLKANAPAKKIIEAIDEFVYRWQKGKRPSKAKLDPEDAPYAMGSLWGQQIVRRFGWEWAMVTFHQHGDSVAPGVLTPDRSLAIYPIHFLFGAMEDSEVDATIALAFNLLEAGEVGTVNPGEYANLMEGVHRIVPRE